MVNNTIFDVDVTRISDYPQLSSSQQKEIQRLHKQVRKWEQTVIAILSLANKLKEGTIEKVFSKDDFEVGLEVLKKWSNGK